MSGARSLSGKKWEMLFSFSQMFRLMNQTKWVEISYNQGLWLHHQFSPHHHPVSLSFPCPPAGSYHSQPSQSHVLPLAHGCWPSLALKEVFQTFSQMWVSCVVHRISCYQPGYWCVLFWLHQKGECIPQLPSGALIMLPTGFLDVY